MQRLLSDPASRSLRRPPESAHRRAGRRRSPFGALRPAVTVACGYAAAALVWVISGTDLPGGRWLAVHLFTLGVLTNLVVALSYHFAQTLLHAPERSRVGRLVAVNTGALLILTGLPANQRWLVASGATALTASVLWLYADLRRIRKASLTGRFAFVVRAYEGACSAFIHGAVLGALMGVGVLTGSWYAAGRLAPLHVNVLGWGGLTLLATVLFFGPTVMRARMEPGADAAGAKGLCRASTGLTVATVALLLTGAGGVMVLPARLAAAAGLVVYATGVAAVCVPVVRTGQRAQPTCASRMLQAACCWFVAVAAADAVVIATGQLRLLDGLGAAMLVGVLGQTILAALGYLVPMAWAHGSEGRRTALKRLGRLPRARPLALNVGVALVAAAATVGTAGGAVGAVAARLGWLLAAAAVALQVVLLAMTIARAAIPAPDQA